MTDAPTQDQIDAATKVLAQAAAAKQAARADKVALVKEFVTGIEFAAFHAAIEALVPKLSDDGEITPHLNALIIGMSGLANVA